MLIDDNLNETLTDMNKVKELKEVINKWDNEDEVMLVTNEELEFMNKNTYEVVLSDNDMNLIVYYG